MRITSPIYKYTGMIAGFGLASLVVGLFLLIASEELSLAGWIIIALGILLLVSAIAIDFRKVKGAVTGKRGRFSAGSTVMVFVFIGIIVFVNAISAQYNTRVDITELAKFTLTSQTKDILTNMETPVDVICFFTPNDQYGIGTYAESLLDEYTNYTDKLTIKKIDPDEHPDEAKEYNISQYQTIVFESEIGRRSVTPELIYQQAEHSFTSAILEVTGVVQKTLYFLTGHGEAEITGEYAYAAMALMDNLYKVRSLDLMTTQEIPEDCSALIIAGPQQKLTALELDILRNYLNNDGHMLLMVNTQVDDSIQELLADWDLEIEEGTVIDEMAYYGTKDNPLIPRTQNVYGDYVTEMYFPGASAITTIDPEIDGLDIVPLFYTSAVSWVEKNFDPTVEPEFNESIENYGARALGVAVFEQIPEDAGEDVTYTQLVVVSDSDFASNQHFYNPYNGYQFLYLVESLTAGEQLVTIERKILPYRSLVVTASEENLIRILSIGLLPLLVLLAGGVIWWRRR
ncbi:MAG: GldG family protein [Dehalococcoidales bacterium]|nr:GldG family protein [Dehalococcoidales bacterium]